MDYLNEDEFKHTEIDELKINKITAILRYTLCGFLITSELKSIYHSYQFFLDSNSFESISFLLIGAFALILYIYYNIKQAKKEYRAKYFISDFKSGTSVIFIIYSTILALDYIVLTIDFYFHSKISLNMISMILLTIMISYVLYREIIIRKRRRLV